LCAFVGQHVVCTKLYGTSNIQLFMHIFMTGVGNELI